VNALLRLDDIRQNLANLRLSAATVLSGSNPQGAVHVIWQVSYGQYGHSHELSHAVDDCNLIELLSYGQPST
jgi:hypothetical protein